MSKELVSNDELSFLAKKNKEMAIEEFLTDMVKEEIHSMQQDIVNQVSLAMADLGVTELQLVELSYEEAEQWAKDQTEEAMTRLYQGTVDPVERHLMVISKKEVVALTETVSENELVDVLNTLMESVATELAKRLEKTLDVEFVSEETGSLMELSTTEQFDLGQLVEKKAFQLTFGEGQAMTVVVLSDVTYLEKAYKMLANCLTLAQNQEVTTSSVSTETEMVFKPRFESLTDPSEDESLTDSSEETQASELALLAGVSLEVSAVLGRTKCSIQDLLELNEGSVVELDKLIDEPIEIYANDKQIAEGELVVIDENFGVKLTRLIK